MRVKFTIAICALLVLGLAVSQVHAQGYQVSSRTNNVVMGGNNQELGAIRLTHRAASEAGINVVQNNTIEITFGDLTITNAGSIEAGNLAAADGAAGTIAAANDDDTKVGKITLTIATHDGSFTISGIRADVSALEDGDTILATISATGAGDGFTPITETTGASATGMVSTVKDGINVTDVGQVSVLTCDAATTGARMPSIKVEEGFAAAWEDDAGDGLTEATDSTQIRIVNANTPAGVTFRWPGQGNLGADNAIGGTGDDADLTEADEGFFANPAAQTVDHDDNDDTTEEPIGNLMFVSAGAGGATVGNDDAKHWAIYEFNGTDIDAGGADEVLHSATKNVFTISPMVTVDTDKTGMGGVSDVWAQLWPQVDDDTATVLSYNTEVETKDEGYFVNVTECVTYLLFPFLTCGAQADWTTGIAVANTSMDDEAFPVNSGAAAQGGSVMIHAYPKSTAAEKAAVGHNSSPEMLADPISTGISGNLAAGDSVAITCNTHPMLAGFEGYAIVRAGFRHAHGMAFVLGNFMDGAAIDVAHGYIALVIPDPEFASTAEGENAPIGRGAASGETLGH